MTTATLAMLGTFALVLAAELPDKTMVATLVLTTRFRALPVFLGVSVAFAVQCVIAVAFGSVLTLLPDPLVAGVVAVLFGAGAAMLLREGFTPADTSGADAARTGPRPVSFLRSALTSGGVLFAAEWGDASQLATAGLTARYAQPFAVGLGSFVALVTVAGIAVIVGHKIRGRIRPKPLQRVAGFVFAGFAAVALGQALF
ncbi:Putative Ca2+/H+ antiporter, TMEM165/GDT1 family [Amycolatopsis arida]|uniref:GDT1 family protein n=1 Tax=Amycolatopsis arida TaxID=587909 RepID=A0A1I5YMN6_9PSEU|nr:TMEM165/GDT1 family protein [Amycolatopsis arida]TDX90633.1 putative Ca2+/H+ antiporter (TMEM165/GDT1 family) [Amycolatopsis arida]SFQ45509.1 Putative Ca2+/H+ antiporter, TMEM165/GDT1 family [Amycolatopsis arida]